MWKRTKKRPKYGPMVKTGGMWVMDDENTCLTLRSDVEHNHSLRWDSLQGDVRNTPRWYSRVDFMDRFGINGIMIEPLNVNKCIKNRGKYCSPKTTCSEAQHIIDNRRKLWWLLRWRWKKVSTLIKVVNIPLRNFIVLG